MMKRMLAVLLVLAMLTGLYIPAAQAAEAAPPDWVKPEEYMVLEGDPVYEGSAWEKILRLRADAAAGHTEPQEGDALYADWTIWTVASNGMRGIAERTPGEWFERGLIAMRYAANSDTKRRASTAATCFSEAQKALAAQEGEEPSPQRQIAPLWYVRAMFLSSGPSSADEALYSRCVDACQTYLTLKRTMSLTLEALYDTPLMDGFPAGGRARVEKEILEIPTRVSVSIDGVTLSPDRIYADGKEYARYAKIINGRTVVPIRWVAERLGADVEWVPESRAVRLIRAGVQIDMPIGSTTAYKNGVPFEMDIAPYVEDGATMIPVRYVAEFFGQQVDFNTETRTVEIREDKSALGESNLEAWALPMGAMLNVLNGRRDPCFWGSYPRGYSYLRGYGMDNAQDYARGMLNGDSWFIENREDLIETVCRMTFFGHNISFLADVEMINSWTRSEYQAVLKNATGMDAYMFPYTKQLGEKWGSRGILCWDLFRMSNLVQWGYLAGYVTYPEALTLLEPAAQLLHDNFKNWDEAYENYLDGYNWWARINVLGIDPWTVTRGVLCRNMLNDPSMQTVLDDTLFQTGVIGLPEAE